MGSRVRWAGRATTVLVAGSLLAAACSSSDQPTDETSTTAATTSITTTAPTSTTTQQQTAPPPEVVHYAGGMDDTPPPNGWRRLNPIQSVSTFLDGAVPERFEVGYHSLLELKPCEEGVSEDQARGPIESQGLEIPAAAGMLCESHVLLETLAMATEATSTIAEHAPSTYTLAAPALNTVTSVYITTPDGTRYEDSTEQQMDFAIELNVGSESFNGTITSASGQREMWGERIGWTLPFTEDRAQAVVDWDASRDEPLPVVDAVSQPPPTGLRVVWFECGLLNTGDNAEDEIQQCAAETAEARIAFDALGWEILVVKSSTTNHGAGAAVPFRDALTLDGDVYFPRGFNVGGWTQADVDELLASGVEIVENGFSADPGPEIDESQWNTHDPESRPPHTMAPLLESWMLAEAAMPYTFGADLNTINTEFDPRMYCVACDVVVIPHDACPPGEANCVGHESLTNLNGALDRRPEMEFVSLGWMEEAAEVLASPEASGLIVVNEAGSAAWTKGGGRHGLERTWYVIDLAVRGLMSDEPIHTTYLRPEPRLYFGDVRPTLSDAWRQTFYDAWGVEPPG